MPKIPDRVLPDQPTHRPLDRFWPYAELSEQPSDEELAALHPELREAIFGASALPFSITISFPRFEGDQYPKAMELAAGADERKDVGADAAFRHLATFFPGEHPARLRDLYDVVGGVPGSEVLIDGKPVPFARELWLPLVWFLIR
ncbi:MAG: hypothetical protein EPO35_11210 [Acidobacteria bacterium]|nr:MAG: hypothetical protein EPO35_11210 [Acidobacteriota bacterium]